VKARAAIAALVVSLAACAQAPATEVREPRPYPDRTSPERTWETYLWAWRQGDVRILEQTYGLWMRHELARQLEAQGAAKVAEWYRRDARDMQVEEARWDKRTRSSLT
jgi:hypothetical protein